MQRFSNLIKRRIIHWIYDFIKPLIIYNIYKSLTVRFAIRTYRGIRYTYFGAKEDCIFILRVMASRLGWAISRR